jgi:hypothetical protein
MLREKHKGRKPRAESTDAVVRNADACGKVAVRDPLLDVQLGLFTNGQIAWLDPSLAGESFREHLRIVAFASCNVPGSSRR